MVYFESKAGQFHYLVAPTKDDYILNSLEKLNFIEFMYRLLREDGYDRVISFELNKDSRDYTLYAYDRLSYYSYLYPLDFQDIRTKSEILDRKNDRESLIGFYQKIDGKIDASNPGPDPSKDSQTGDKRSAQGTTTYDKAKREYGKNSPVIKLAELDSEIRHRMKLALESTKLKTAILFPVSYFKDEGSGLDAFKILSNIQRKLMNIMIFYCEKENDLSDLRRIMFLQEDFPGNEYPVEKSIERLKSKTERFHSFRRKTRDDIRNYILREMFIESNPRFAEISLGVTEELSNKLYRHFSSGTKVFSTFTSLANEETFNIFLDALFKDKENFKEIVQFSKSLAVRNPAGVSPNVKGTDIERVTGAGRPYFNEEDALEALDRLIGLASVKKEINTFKNKRIALGTASAPSHFAFLGNPGTGKTEVARLMGRILKNLGVLKSGHLVEVKRNEIEAEYVGQTSHRMAEKIDEAIGGVLFIDEAYWMTDDLAGGSFAKQAYNLILQRMENERSELCVIVAGYKDLMEKFLSANPGMASRIPTKLIFENYTVGELKDILSLMAEEQGFALAEEYIDGAGKIFASWLADIAESYANARDVRNMLEKSIGHWANRMVADGKTAVNVEKVLQREDLGIDLLSVEEESVIKPTFKPFCMADLERLMGAKKNQPYTDNNRNAFYAAVEDALLFIESDKGGGTGFLFSPEGYAITCDHVVNGARDVRARLRIKDRPGGRDSWHLCTVLNSLPGLDMAVIKLEGNNFPFMKIASPFRPIERDESVVLIGYPFGEKTNADYSNFSGRIASSGDQKDEYGIRYLLNMEAKCGNSGGPIIARKDGEVIGVLLGSILNHGRQITEEINYMRPIQYFWEIFTDGIPLRKDVRAPKPVPEPDRIPEQAKPEAAAVGQPLISESIGSAPVREKFIEALREKKVEFKGGFPEVKNYDNAVKELARYLGDHYQYLGGYYDHNDRYVNGFFDMLKNSYFDVVRKINGVDRVKRDKPRYINFNLTNQKISAQPNENQSIELEPYELRTGRYSTLLTLEYVEHIREYSRLLGKYLCTEQNYVRDDFLVMRLAINKKLLDDFLSGGYWFEVYTKAAIEEMIKETSTKYGIPADQYDITKGANVLINGKDQEFDVLAYYCGEILCLECKTGNFKENAISDFHSKITRAGIASENAFLLGPDKPDEVIETANYEKSCRICNMNNFKRDFREAIDNIAKKWEHTR